MITTPLLKKPLYNSVFGVYNKYVLQALKNPPLKVCTSKGEMIVDPKWVIEHCELIEAEFRIPGRPMKLYKVDIKPQKPETEVEQAQRLYKQGVFF